VERGELTANAAMIEAGFRKATFKCPRDPVKAAVKVREVFTGEDWAIFLEEIHERVHREVKHP
jgi:hypothetical protein